MKKICQHLSYELMEEEEIYYYIYFTGKGKEYFFVCEACVEKKNYSSFKEIHDSRILKFFKGAESNYISIVGKPEIAEEHTMNALLNIAEFHFTGHILARPYPTKKFEYAVLQENGENYILTLINAMTGEIRSSYRFRYDMDLGFDKVDFKISKDGSLIVIYQTFGSYAEVYDLEDGIKVMTVDRGDYHNKHCMFSVEWIEKEGDQLLIHASDWNQLDITDVRTNYCLTTRKIEGDKEFADYFHCNISVSPNQRWILDDGWIWAPIGILKSWSIDDWLNDPWLFDDDEKTKTIRYAHYFWDAPLCWIDNDRIAMYGFGDDAAEMVNAALIYNVTEDTLEGWFPGPCGEFEFNGEDLVTYSEDKLSVWDLSTGKRKLSKEGIRILAVGKDGTFLYRDGDKVKSGRFEKN